MIKKFEQFITEGFGSNDPNIQYASKQLANIIQKYIDEADETRSFNDLFRPTLFEMFVYHVAEMLNLHFNRVVKNIIKEFRESDYALQVCMGDTEEEYAQHWLDSFFEQRRQDLINYVGMLKFNSDKTFEMLQVLNKQFGNRAIKDVISELMLYSDND